jgi:hypothetical protein
MLSESWKLAMDGTEVLLVVLCFVFGKMDDSLIIAYPSSTGKDGSSS